jgi:hypothetical protein
MPNTFYANNNSIEISNATQTIFSTSRRMPHIVSAVSGTFNSADATITSSSNGVFVSTTKDTYVASNGNFKFADSFVWAWLKITSNANRTDLDIGNPIFLTGSVLLRFYIGNNSLRGSYILTPMIYGGHIGFREEWNFANNNITNPPGGLYATDVAETNGNLGLTYSYTLYYGRFI